MRYRYTKYVAEPARRARPRGAGVEAVRPAAVERVRQPVGDPVDGGDRTMQALHDAILEALFNGGVLPRRTCSSSCSASRPTASEDAAARAARGADPADHRAHEGAGLHHDAARPRQAERERRAGRRRRRGRARPRHVRGHRQGARLPRLPRAARPARLARPQQRRPARHARAGHRRRGQRRAEAVRVRRHAEPRRERDDPQRRAARRGRPSAASVRLRGPDGRAGRVPELVRHGADARLQPQHDPLRRGSLHAGQARGAGAVAPDPHAVSRATRCTSCSSTTPPRRSRCASSAACASAPTTRTRARACGSRAASSSASARTCGRSS